MIESSLSAPDPPKPADDGLTIIHVDGPVTDLQRAFQLPVLGLFLGGPFAAVAGLVLDLRRKHGRLASSERRRTLFVAGFSFQIGHLVLIGFVFSLFLKSPEVSLASEPAVAAYVFVSLAAAILAVRAWFRLTQPSFPPQGDDRRH